VPNSLRAGLEIQDTRIGGTAVHSALFGPVVRHAKLPFLAILAACVLPDLPWILRRILIFAGYPNADQLYAYTIAQASLLGSSVLAVGVAAIFNRWLLVTLTIIVGCALHLVLDALQDKWGNGIHLLAPFDWTMWSLGVAETDGWLLIVLSGIGLLPFLLARPRDDAKQRTQKNSLNSRGP